MDGQPFFFASGSGISRSSFAIYPPAWTTLVHGNILAGIMVQQAADLPWYQYGHMWELVKVLFVR